MISLRQVMKDNPNGRQCSICGLPVKAAPRGIRACICATCMAKRTRTAAELASARKEEKEHAHEQEVAERKAARGMDVLAAATALLREVGEPMHVKDLTAKMIDDGLWKPRGSTPQNTVYARIFKAAGFRKTAPSTFALETDA